MFIIELPVCSLVSNPYPANEAGFMVRDPQTVLGDNIEELRSQSTQIWYISFLVDAEGLYTLMVPAISQDHRG